ncbi:MAG: ROK family protein, partial [Lachnospiraceae bacterium]|nr:ROK family protein [Lachnospiraceae bacterium]
MRETGSNNETLRQKNRGLVLRLVTTGECTSRIGVAKYTRLSKMAATNIISQLIDEDIIEEKETIRVKGKGRNPIQLDLSKRAPKLIGVNIASDICSVVLCDMHLRILGKTGFYVHKVSPDKVMDNICRCIDRVIKKSPKERFWGIGIAVPGPVHLSGGTILSHSGFSEMENIPIVEILKEKYHMPVLLESRQSCAALAEKYYGNGHDTEDFLLVGIGEEIGLGVISHGDLRESSSGMTPELGHMSIDMNGRECCCGRKGCLRSYIEGSVLRAEYAGATGMDVTFREMCRVAEKGEEAADRILGEMTERL